MQIATLVKLFFYYSQNTQKENFGQSISVESDSGLQRLITHILNNLIRFINLRIFFQFLMPVFKTFLFYGI